MIKKIIKFFWRNYFEEQRILKNSFWIAFSRFVSSALRAILIIYSFRILGPSLQGSFSLAMNFILIFSFIPDFGLTAVLIRELVQNQERRKEILSNAIFSLLALMALSLIFIHLTKNIFIKDKLAINVIFILSLFLVFDTLREFLYAIFRAEEKMELQGISHILTNLLLLIFGITFLEENPTPMNLSYAYLLAGFVGFAFTFFILRKEFMFNLFRFLKLKTAFQLLNKSWPIGVANFLFLILTYIDSLIIGWFRGSKDVGLYNASVKISEFLYFFPAAIAMALFPIVSKKLRENRENLKETLSFAFQFSVFISFPIFIGIFVLAPEIINFLFGKEYLISHPALRLISFSIPINFFSLILLDMLIALDKRKELLFYDFLVVLVNFILNLIFVPEFSYFASSLITSISTFLSMVFAYLILRKYIVMPIKNIKFKNYLFSSLMMGGLILILPASINVVLKVFLGAIIYFLFLYLLRDELILDKIKFYLNAS